MQITSSISELRAAVQSARQAGRTIGLVPTMGALHAGHVSLVAAARRGDDFTVATIFVNPTQFGPHEDFERYPRTLEADLDALRAAGADLVFVPARDDVYRPGHATFVEVSGVAEPLEGACRPGHFRGVATVVLKLFNMAAPDRAYFGQKDFQQTLVVRQMVTDFDLPIDVRVCPTVRESDGLAMSSRNAYLSATERRQATVLYRSLRRGAELVAGGERDARTVLQSMRAVYADAPDVAIEYLEIADRATLQSLTVIDRPAVAVVAARLGRTRLIDNELLESVGKPNDET
ncbi:MAG TPA: pantoate--beta-alanine ligase [Pirellulales bacterium]|nr:pantoate--beta-alanine ligase [Pirellulales bacterium]